MSDSCILHLNYAMWGAMVGRVLIVEDEILVALDIESTLRDIGVDVIGIAADSESALRYAAEADFALVDVNLRDGQTGPAIGKTLAQDYGVGVLFVTANPAILGGGIEGTLGVITKPISDGSIHATIDYFKKLAAEADASPPDELKLFA